MVTKMSVLRLPVSFVISIDELSLRESISEGVCLSLIAQPPHLALTA